MDLRGTLGAPQFLQGTFRQLHPPGAAEPIRVAPFDERNHGDTVDFWIADFYQVDFSWAIYGKIYGYLDIDLFISVSMIDQ